MNVTINIVQLASELADLELRNFFQGQIDIEDNDGEIISYTNEAQDLFDELYDKYYYVIESNITTPKLQII